MAEIPINMSTPTREAIFDNYKRDARSEFRAHFGASIAGKDCSRALWYDFHWTTRPNFDGRMYRLFETGEREEGRLVQNLRKTGATVLEVDPQTGRQFTVSAVDGHFGGSADGVAIGLLEAPKTWHVLEFKTHSVKSFNALLAKKVFVSKPQHYAQVQIYMHLLGLTRAMYIAVCKNTDDLYVERIEYDKIIAEQLLEKAKGIIYAPEPPPGISDDRDFYQCRMCNHRDICFGESKADVNCRTCLHSEAIPGAWQCNTKNVELTIYDQREGCGGHLYNPKLINAEQVDSGEGWVEYKLANGALWRDVGSDKSKGSA